MSFGYTFRAEYESGLVVTDEDPDHSPYAPGRNLYHSVCEGHPTAAGHGPLVRLSLIGPERRLDIDCAELIANPHVTNVRPLYFKRMDRAVEVMGPEQIVVRDSGPICKAHVFGYQYNDATTGANVQNVTEIPV
jgi:hypothetical protein